MVLSRREFTVCLWLQPLSPICYAVYPNMERAAFQALHVADAVTHRDYFHFLWIHTGGGGGGECLYLHVSSEKLFCLYFIFLYHTVHSSTVTYKDNLCLTVNEELEILAAQKMRSIDIIIWRVSVLQVIVSSEVVQVNTSSWTSDPRGFFLSKVQITDSWKVSGVWPLLVSTCVENIKLGHRPATWKNCHLKVAALPQIIQTCYD